MFFSNIKNTIIDPNLFYCSNILVYNIMRKLADHRRRVYRKMYQQHKKQSNKRNGKNKKIHKVENNNKK